MVMLAPFRRTTLPELLTEPMKNAPSHEKLGPPGAPTTSLPKQIPKHVRFTAIVKFFTPSNRVHRTHVSQRNGSSGGLPDPVKPSQCSQTRDNLPAR